MYHVENEVLGVVVRGEGVQGGRETVNPSGLRPFCYSFEWELRNEDPFIRFAYTSL